MTSLFYQWCLRLHMYMCEKPYTSQGHFLVYLYIHTKSNKSTKQSLVETLTCADDAPDTAPKLRPWASLVVVVGLVDDARHCPPLHRDTDQHRHVVE